LAALALLIGLASYYVPVVGAFLMLVTPLPAAVAAVRYGTRLAILTAAVATLIAVPAGGLLAAVFVLSSCAMGVALGHGMARQWRVSWTLLLGGVTFAVSAGLSTLTAVQVTGPATLTALRDAGEGSVLATVNLARAMGFADLAAAADSVVPVIRQYFWELTALSVVPGGYGWAFVWYSVCAPVLRRLGHSAPEPAVAPVARWSLPPAVGLGFLLTFTAAVYLGPRLAPGSLADVVAQVAFNLVFLAFVFQGYGLLAFLITRAGPAPALRMTLIGAAFLLVFWIPQLAQLTALAGMLDLALGYRSGRLLGGPARPGPRGQPPRAQPVTRARRATSRSQGVESPGGEFVRRRPEFPATPDAQDPRQGKSR
jgi:uncharacterized protein YybS (DUF2232 family)